MLASEGIVSAPAPILVRSLFFLAVEKPGSPVLTITDRPLTHINKKGRPVSQCPHCRGLRKARAQHVKCDCGEKPHTKEDCPHDKNDVKKGIAQPTRRETLLIVFAGDHTSCCCAHGARCTCSLKKEHCLDPVPEDVPPAMLETRIAKERCVPSRLSSTSSMESKTTVFINGHHKPVHKANDIHNWVGAPYKIPARSHTLHEQGDFAQHSSDSLPLTKDLMGGLPNLPYHGSVTSAPHPVRRVKSEHGSPTINALPLPSDNDIPPISIPPYDPNAYSYSPFSTGSPGISSAGSNPWDGRFPERFPDNYFVTYEMANEMQTPVSSVGPAADPAEIDWSTYNLPSALGNSAAGYRLSNGGVIPSQPPSYASFDGFSHLSHPALTSSSGEISEVEDFVPVAEPAILQSNSQDALNDFSGIDGDEPTDLETFRLSTGSSYVNMPQANFPPSASLDAPEVGEYVKNAEENTREVALHNQMMQRQQQRQQPEPSQIVPSTANIFTQPADLGQHSFSVQEAQKRAHPNRQDDGSGLENRSVTTTTLRNDPMMSCPLAATHGMMDADERDDGWVR